MTRLAALVLPLLGLLLFRAAPTFALPLTVVDIDFDGVPTGASPPLSGTGPVPLPNDRLVAMNFGAARAVDGVAGMDHPLQLLPTQNVTTNFNYSQALAFNGPVGGLIHTHLISMDMYLSGFAKRGAATSRSVDEFSILFDLPSVRRLDFTTDGSVGQISYGGTPVYVGNFSFDEVHHLAIYLDTASATWSAWLDGNVLFADVLFFNPSAVEFLGAVRIHLTDDAQLANVPAAFVDNIVVTHSPVLVPEPSTLALCLGAGVLLLPLAKRRASRVNGIDFERRAR
jgi:hypothetical protein